MSRLHRSALLFVTVLVVAAGAACKGGPDPGDGSSGADLRAPPPDLDCQVVVSTTCYIPDPPRCRVCPCGYRITKCDQPGLRCTFEHDATSPGPYTFVVECAPDGSLTCISGPCWGNVEDLGTKD